LILLGTFKVYPWLAVLAATGVVLGAIYMLWMFQRVFFGPVTEPKNEDLRDLTPREIAVFVPLIALIFVMGVYPKPFLDRMEPAVNSFIRSVQVQRVSNEVPADEQLVFGNAEVTLPGDDSGARETSTDDALARRLSAEYVAAQASVADDDADEGAKDAVGDDATERDSGRGGE
jgi:hypothetical protein